MWSWAGSHQIWRMDLDGSHAEPYTGSGAEGLLDGPLNRASLAQPFGDHGQWKLSIIYR